MRIAYIQDQEIYQYENDYYHAKSVHFFARYLVGLKENEKLTVFCGIIKVKKSDDIKNYQKITDERIVYEELPDFRDIKNLKKIIKKIENEIGKFNFLYLRTGIVSSIASYYCNRKKIPYMSIVNEDVYKNCKISSKRIVRLSAYPLWLGARYAIKHAKYVCYVTQNYLQKKYPTRGKKIGCSDVEMLELRTDVLKRRIEKIDAYDESICIIGIAGSVETYLKAHDVIIKSLKLLNIKSKTKYILEIVGAGSTQRLVDIAKAEKVEEQVFFLGEKSHESVIQWMDHIDIYVHPSRSEGLPRTIIEAMSRATPCICSNVGGIPELVDSRYLFSYKNKNPEKELAELLLCMNKNEMKKQAAFNFKKAQSYAPELLSDIRKKFFEDVVDIEREA